MGPIIVMVIGPFSFGDRSQRASFAIGECLVLKESIFSTNLGKSLMIGASLTNKNLTSCSTGRIMSDIQARRAGTK